ncbi:hypothetical protein AJ80_08962 [Polytolypa hystricis UAMH7299]|uniref:Uncharacterized protein n=1 Tax=Polytolypa hystricis (strain UAMH7299) TaxID=1447883 RepID=A0A2B7WYN6_POLH7|nr:hypothetical protein AJ80_08962 [Polytolypa hystricis UAMH7299]
MPQLLDFPNEILEAIFAHVTSRVDETLELRAVCGILLTIYLSLLGLSVSDADPLGRFNATAIQRLLHETHKDPDYFIGHHTVDFLMSQNLINDGERERYLKALLVAAGWVIDFPKIVKSVLRKSDAASKPSAFGESSLRNCALVAAAYQDEVSFMTLLISRDANVDARTRYFGNPHRIAVMSGSAAAVGLLLGERARLPNIGKDGQSLLHVAAGRGHAAVVQRLLSGDRLRADDRDCEGKTPLLLAAAGGYLAVVKLLIERDDVIANSKDREGWSPLAHAVDRGHIAVVKFLMARADVDINSTCNNGDTPLILAVKTGCIEMVTCLLGRRDLSVNCVGSSCVPDVSVAAQLHNEEIVEPLLRPQGVNATCQGIRGTTPLTWIAQSGMTRIVKGFLDGHYGDCDIKRSGAYKALCMAAKVGNLDVMKLLVDWGVLVEERNHVGRTALSFAAEEGRLEAVKLLISKDGVDMNRRSRDGRTPLCFAAERGHAEVVKVLAKQDKVDLTASDYHMHRTPEMHALLKGHEAVAELIWNGIHARMQSTASEIANCDEAILSPQ